MRTSKPVRVLSLLFVVGLLLFASVPINIQAASNSQTFNPTADAFVYSSQPTQNYGSSTSIRVDGSPVMRSYLRFDLSGLNGNRIRKATLKIYANSSLDDGFAVDQETDHSWQEEAITYQNAPAPGSNIANSGSVLSGQWISVDVSSYVTEPGVYDFSLAPLSDVQLNLASRESGANAPQLEVSITGSGKPTSDATSTPTATDTPVQASPTPTSPALQNSPTPTNPPVQSSATPSATPVQTTPTATPTATSISNSGSVPHFSHVFVMIFENREYSSVVGSSSWPNFNSLASQYALLTQFYAVAHPSLPNYIALTSGSTQGITSDCTTCFVNASNISDLIESSGRTWKGYMESMPAPCYLGNSGTYAQKHNPFVYYDDIRTVASRCANDVPLTQFDSDLANHSLPDFVWITPNLCNDGHDCSSSTADTFLGKEVNKILASPDFDSNSLLVITFDEGTSSATCCGLPSSAGGHIATLLISPLVKSGYRDSTPYSHYSLEKTISDSWGMPYLAHVSDPGTTSITAPWK